MYRYILVFISHIRILFVRSQWHTKAFALHTLYSALNTIQRLSGSSSDGGVLNDLWLTLTLTLLDILVIGPTTMTSTAMFSFSHRLQLFQRLSATQRIHTHGQLEQLYIVFLRWCGYASVCTLTRHIQIN